MRKNSGNVVVGADPGIDADQLFGARRAMTRALQQFPRALQEETMLRVQGLRFAGAETEECRVKQINVIERCPRFYVMRIVQCSPGGLLAARNSCSSKNTTDSFPAFRFSQNSSGLLCARNAAVHADDGDVRTTDFSFV